MVPKVLFVTNYNKLVINTITKELAKLQKEDNSNMKKKA